ncbi:acyltransferase [Nocardioides sp. cx-169]|uniref:acyltransferase family protein n=1 Tax=Nocardioides sp. cx-169 TaxID=2899080 RepID=UPI001E56605F|nr:acyltransferase family protein [Nocardioides sp. cx-169]MCD4534167.1 acyltransferase [Nocardioides sp. cx-169]
MASAPSPGMGFRPEIQGMRALAVGLVIVAHAGFAGFEGGFVGVDVFFVISGFLITSLLVREADRSGRISLGGFYARRARRILPAAVVVLVATVVAATLLLPLVRALEIGKDAVWSSFFAANIRFAQVGTDYFAQGEPTSPLQHFWSLAVEEQFYLVWPLILIGWLAVARRRSGTPRHGVLLALLLALSLASFAWSLYATYESPVTAYFSTLTRAWELGAGAATALWLSRGEIRLPRPVRQGMGAAGLLAILASVVVLDAGTAFPGYAAALPVLGTVLLIASGDASGREGQTLVSRVLSLPPLLVIGNWSYSLYLWHWPVLRIAEDRLGVAHLGGLRLLLALALIVALSAATYRWVEEPFRRGRRWSRPSFGIALYPAGVVLVVAVVLSGRQWVVHELGLGGNDPAITTADFADRRLSDDPQLALVQASVLAAREGREVPSDLTPSLLGIRKATAPLGDCDYRTGTTQLCPLGDSDADLTVALIGDSHARAWSPAFDELGSAEGFRAFQFVYSGCSATQAVQAERETERPWEECQDFKAWTLEALEDLQPDLIVVATSAVSPVMSEDGSRLVFKQEDAEEFREVVGAGFAEQLRLLEPLAPRLVVLGNTPQLPREPGVCLTSGEVDLGDCLFEAGPQARAIQMGFRDAARRAGAPFVNAAPWFCFDKQCPSVVGSTVTMRDKEHMTPDYARQLAVPLGRRLGLVEAAARS